MGWFKPRRIGQHPHLSPLRERQKSTCRAIAANFPGFAPTELHNMVEPEDTRRGKQNTMRNQRVFRMAAHIEYPYGLPINMNHSVCLSVSCSQR